MQNMRKQSFPVLKNITFGRRESQFTGFRHVKNPETLLIFNVFVRKNNSLYAF